MKFCVIAISLASNVLPLPFSMYHHGRKLQPIYGVLWEKIYLLSKIGVILVN